METFRGLIYIKQGRIGYKIEGPDYYLQTFNKEYFLKYENREPWKLDKYLESFCRKFVEVTGELDSENNVINVKDIQEIDVKFIPRD